MRGDLYRLKAPLTVIDPETRLGNFAGRLNHSEMQAVNAALQTVLALD